METFLVILVLVTLGLLTTGARFYRLRRSRTITALHSGGWLALLVGLVLGPMGTGLINEQAVRASMPLLQIGLGWIGFMVGLQLQRGLLRRTPIGLMRMAGVDAIVSALLVGGLCALAIAWQTPEGATAKGIALGIATLAAGGIGWAMETRSVGFNDAPAHASASLAIRAGGGIAAVLAIAGHGIAVAFLGGEADRTGDIVLRGAILLSLAGAAALAAAMLGAFGLGQAGRERDQQITVFLGMLAMVAGLATQTGASTLLAAMLAGACVANLPGQGLREFERFMLRGEHAVATIFSLLAGLLVARIDNWSVVALAAAVLGVRLLIKPALAAWLLPSLEADPARADRPEERASARALAGIASMRQSPIAIALMVSVVLVWPSPSTKAALGALVIAGVLAELIALLARRRLMATGGFTAPYAGAELRARSSRIMPHPIGGGAGRAERARRASEQRSGEGGTP